VINVGNSGTTARLIAGVATLGPHAGYTVITGDQQTRKRPMGTLITALNSLGAMVYSTTGDGTLPIVIRGKLRGGETTVEGVSSQFVSSLLLCCPLTEDNTVIYVNHLNERPYVEMTLWWLNKQGVHYQHSGLEHFEIMGGQRYQPFKERIAADFSSATFFLCAAAITGSELVLQGLDMEDPQGDKKVIEVLEAMGAAIDTTEEGITVRGGQLRGIEVDMNDIPDALPSLAVVGCMAEGKTALRNVKHARLKETDRITAMARELTKLGARVEELEDGMVVHRSDLTGTQLDGHHDHRIVMSLAVAGLAAEGTTTIDSAEAIAATFPNFAKLMVSAGADMALIKDK
jgi:3-phosphoshikimate 1-carboxyvinyltransferase